jgi:type III pantothenate kinase
MHLALDIGNTTSKLAALSSDRLIRFSSSKNERVLYQKMLLLHLETLLPEDTEEPVNLWIASVVPELTETVKGLHDQTKVALRFLEASVLQADTASAVDFSGYRTPTLGIDRMLDMLAAEAFLPRMSKLVIDIGTTTTLDWVTERGVFEGGVICPGPQAFSTLIQPQTTAQLKQFELGEPPEAFPGRDTASCIENGLYWSYAGILKSMIDKFEPVQHIMLTGGDALLFTETLQTQYPSARYYPELCLEGIKRVIGGHSTRFP